MDLLGHYKGRFLATDHVEEEIEDENQRARYAAAVAAGYLDTCTVTDSDELALYMQLSSSQRLGFGECAAIAVAIKRHLPVAIDDVKAVNRAVREVGLTKVQVIRTPDIMVALIRDGIITIFEADSIKDAWEKEHRFRVKAASFAEML